MDAREFIINLAASTRAWRERIMKELQDEGCSDLSYRPRTGMSSFGWLLAHQGAAYDYTLNMLIKGHSSIDPNMFFSYRGDSSDNGEWKGASLEKINNYFDSAEREFLTWFKQASDEELNRKLDGSDTPEYFYSKRVIEAIADMFAHLNHHNGHLSAIKGDWCQQKRML